MQGAPHQWQKVPIYDAGPLRRHDELQVRKASRLSVQLHGCSYLVYLA